MPRKPSAAVPRSETTAELIARISAERDAPVTPDRGPAGRSRAGVLDAPAPARRPTARAADLPRQRAVQEGEYRRPRASDNLRTPPALPRRRQDRPLRSVGTTQRPSEPEPDDTPTEAFGFVEPIAPQRRGLGRRIGPIAMAATAVVGIVIAVAQGFTFPGFADPGADPSGAVLEVAVPEPAPTGPTVPAPQDAAPVDTAPVDVAPDGAADEPAADPQSDVTVTDAAVPQSDYSY